MGGNICPDRENAEVPAVLFCPLDSAALTWSAQSFPALGLWDFGYASDNLIGKNYADVACSEVGRGNKIQL